MSQLPSEQASSPAQPQPTGPQNMGLSSPAQTGSQPVPPFNPANALWQEDLFLPDAQQSGAMNRPFELSEALPALEATPTSSAPEQLSGNVFAAPTRIMNEAFAPPSALTHKKRGSKRTLLKVFLIFAVILIAMSFLGLVVFAGGGSPQTMRTQGTTQTHTQANTPRPGSTVAKPQPTVKPTATLGTISTTGGNWVPSQLPAGWTQAGLNTGDALFALRTGMTFTDREMSIDYRDVGTRDNHGGTLTAAAFLLTSAAHQRYLQNDVRIANNTLFDMVTGTKLIQAVVNAQPALVLFQSTGGQQFAWVRVSFQLWQSQIDPQTGQRQSGIEMATGSNQPLTHQMYVLLLRVDPTQQNSNSAMGGSGWLVSNYSLDPPNNAPPEIIQPA